MTILALDTAVSAALKAGAILPAEKAASSSNGSKSRPLPTRINLRKRASGSTFQTMNLESVNSAFLSGLFADVAQASSSAEDPHSEQPPKKSKISKTKSLARCGRSYMQLVSIPEALNKASDMLKDLSPEHLASPVKANTSCFIERQDSLHYQLDCVSSSSCSAADTYSGSSESKIAFPHLSKSASDSSSSCDKQLTRVVSDLQSSVTENNSEKNESYGWFVEMEDESTKNDNGSTVDPYASIGNQGLAFQAHTAPVADKNHDAEVEWAKAADTVDDVLGDFF